MQICSEGRVHLCTEKEGKPWASFPALWDVLLGLRVSFNRDGENRDQPGKLAVPVSCSRVTGLGQPVQILGGESV